MKRQRKRKSVLPAALMGVGGLLLIGTAVAWLLLRGPDAWAVATLPTPGPQNIPLVNTPTAAAAASIDSTPTPIPAVIPTADLPLAPTSESSPTPWPTLDVSALPSESRADTAPRSLRPDTVGRPQRVIIPSIGVDAPIWEVGLSTTQLAGDIFYQWQVPSAYAAGWHQSSSALGNPGNTVLNGHHNVFGEVFRDLVDLELGDGIIVRDGENSYVYKVTQMEILPERDQSKEIRAGNANWIRQTTDERVTLVTCWPYTNNTHRLVVVAKPAADY